MLLAHALIVHNPLVDRRQPDDAETHEHDEEVTLEGGLVARGHRRHLDQHEAVAVHVAGPNLIPETEDGRHEKDLPETSQPTEHWMGCPEIEFDKRKTHPLNICCHPN